MSEDLELRDATIDDCDLIWQWRNHESSRRMFVTTAEIPLSDHRIWYRKAFCENRSIYFIGEREGIPIGYVRFDMNQKLAPDISFVVDPEFRGKGIGEKMMQLSCLKLFETQEDIDRLYTSASKDNPASFKVFRRLGFSENEFGEKFIYEIDRESFVRTLSRHH